jgi:hypothetical protein
VLASIKIAGLIALASLGAMAAASAVAVGLLLMLVKVSG